MVTYYVKVAGGTGAGTMNSTAWSYAKYNSMASSLLPGDTVMFLQGDTFYGTLSIKEGTIGNPITYTSYNNGVAGANPIINGLTTLSSWTLSSGNIYYATLDFAGLQGVYIDGVLKGMGRYPNSGYLTYTSHTAKSGGFQTISGSSVATLPTSFVGGEVVIKKYRYIIDRHTITNQTSSTLTYTYGGTITGVNSSYDPTDGNGYFIQNHLSCLDSDGEWYYDNTAKRLYVYFSGSPSSHTIQANTINNLAAINSQGYINFSGLDFVGGNYGLYCNSINNVTVTNCNFSKQSGRGAIYADGANTLTVTGGFISDINNTAILVEQNAVNCTIDGVNFNNIGIIPGTGWSGDEAQGGVWINGTGTTVKNCTVTNVGYVGIASFDSNNWLVEKNFVSYTGLTKDDGAGIYCYTSDGLTNSNRIIRNNIVLYSIGNAEGALSNGDTTGEQAAIYLDGYSNNTLVTNNVCAYGNWMGILNNGNSNNTITNNLTYDFPTGLTITQTALTGFGSTRGLVITGNKFIAKTSTQVPLRVEFFFVSDNPQSFGTFNNNYYARPINETADIVLNRAYSGGGGLSTITLATWKSTYGLDSSSLISQVTTGSTTNLRFDYNFTSSSSTVAFSGSRYKDVTGAIFDHSETLAAYGGSVLIYDSAISTTGKIMKNPSGKVLTLVSGKIMIE
jgi:parallel beta-helix repeat protein